MSENTAPQIISPPVRQDILLKGEVVYMFAFDIAYDMRRADITTLLGQPIGTFAIDSSKRSPKQLFFYRPQMVHLPPMDRIGPHGQISLRRTVKIMPVGAISVTVRVPFAVKSLQDLVEFHDIKFNTGTTLAEEVRAMGEQIRRELTPHLINPVQQIGDVEAYTVFCIEGPIHANAEQWFNEHRQAIAAVLTQEPDPELLSEQEAHESCNKYITYYKDDIAIVDWDAALIVDDPREWDESLYIMELGNVQLAELEAYDRILDDAVERAYRDLSNKSVKGQSSRRIQSNLQELRIDTARMNDELQNITKFFGDWHLARLYENVANRFHLQDWQRSISGKLRALDDLYQMLHTNQMNKWMLILEISIVFLFVFEIAKSFWK